MDRRPAVKQERFFTILAPIYNEEENIRRFLTGIREKVAGPCEVVLVYDFDEDRTLPVIRELPPSELPQNLRLVKNELGRGVVNAIKVGFREALGDAIVVVMADCSDRFELIDVLAARIADGADVAAGSRYMKGGTQQGGGVIKSNLSRLAGTALYFLTGLPIHDATTNFRAYSRRVADQLEIESTGGFELALELTVKAHFRYGWRVEEIPSHWRDRTGGQSNFRLWRWLPCYLRWFFEAYGRSVQPRSTKNPSGMPQWWTVVLLAIAAATGLTKVSVTMIPIAGAIVLGVVGGILALVIWPPVLRTLGRLLGFFRSKPQEMPPQSAVKAPEFKTVSRTHSGM